MTGEEKEHFCRFDDVTNILNGRPMHAVIRAVVDWRVFSLCMHLFTGLVMHELCMAADA